MSIIKLPIKKIVEFRRLPEKSQPTFANNLKVTKDSSSDGGGDYWVRSISTISSAFRRNDNSVVKDKIEEVTNLLNITQRNQTKTMYQRNLDILDKYKNFDFTDWRPTADLNFLKKPKSILDMNGLPIQIRPNHVFSYGVNNKSIGGVWFITWLKGFKLEDLGIYSEALYRYLSSYFSQDYVINPAACMAIDVSNMEVLGYNKVLNGHVPSLLDSSIESIKKRLG